MVARSRAELPRCLVAVRLAACELALVARALAVQEVTASSLAEGLAATGATQYFGS